MTGYRITSSPDAALSDTDAVRSGLQAYNERQAGPAHARRVHLFVRDADGTVRGGLLGRQFWGWLYVEILWVHEALRGAGWGSRLLRQAEEEAMAAGCTRAVLDTFEFQAKPFYEKQGYTVFGVLEDCPPGGRRYYLRKELSR